MIRKAEPRDRRAVSRLHYMAGERVFSFFFASRGDTMLAIIERLYETTDTFCSMPFFSVFDDGGRVTGAIGLFPGVRNGELGDNVGRYARDILRIAGPLSLLKMLTRIGLSKRLPPVGPDDLYIQALAVEPSARGRGIAASLLDYAFDEARAQGVPYLSLHAETDNRHAIAIYERRGFVIEQTVMLEPRYARFGLTGVQYLRARV